MLRRFVKDQEGAAFIEGTMLILLVLTLIGGGMDFLFAANQWNSAMKAVERGARLAAVSAPIDERIRNICVSGCLGRNLGSPLADVRWTSVCTSSGCQSSDTIVNAAAGSTYDAAALTMIVNGRPAA